jgi:hypothetical protein
MLLLRHKLKGAENKVKSIFKAERRNVLLLAIFQIIVGIVHIIVLALSNLAIFTSAILALLSFIAAYGLLASKKWAVWLVIALFFPQLAFGAATLNATILNYSVYEESTFMILGIGLAAFIILSFIAFVYVTAKRKSLLTPV